jgi:hypothetical protein
MQERRHRHPAKAPVVEAADAESSTQRGKRVRRRDHPSHP